MCNESVKPHCCSSSIVSVSAKDCLIRMFKKKDSGCYVESNHAWSTSIRRIDTTASTGDGESVNASVSTHTTNTSTSRPGSPQRTSRPGSPWKQQQQHASSSSVFKKPSVLNAFQWIDTHLITPYYSKSFLLQLIECAIHHSHVFLVPPPNNSSTVTDNNGKSSSDDDDDNDDERKNELSMHLFLEATGGLCGRKGGPTFEIKVLFDFILKHQQNQQQNDDHDFTSTSTTKLNESFASFGMLDTQGTFQSDDMINVEEMIAFIYRLALSCHVLQNWTVDNDENEHQDNEENDNDDGENSHQKGKTKLDLEHIALLGEIPPRNIIESLGSYVGSSSSTSPSIASPAFSNFGENEIKKEVNYETFRNWVEIHFPQMANILSTFIHLAFFSWGIDHDDDDNDNEEEFVNLDEDAEFGLDDVKSIHNDDDDDDDELKMNILSLYAQGKRKIFQFPQLEQLIVGKTLVNKSITNNIIATPPASSILFDTETFTYNDKDGNKVSSTGPAGHFGFGMACMDSNLCGKWHRLYSTEADGFAFVNMQRALTGYTGPTVMIVRPTNATSTSTSSSNSTSGLFGFYTSDPWKESNSFYGTSDCFLFRSEPIWNVYRPQSFVHGWKIEQAITENSSLSPLRKKKMKENYMYFHPSAGHVKNSGRSSSGSGVYGSTKVNKPFGVVVGGTIDQPRFQISETFEQCIASSGNMMDTTFEGGPLLPGQWDKYFNIDVLEVWGVGGEDVVRNASSDKEQHEDIVDAARKKVQRVDRKQFLDDFTSGLHGSKLFEHRLDDSVRHDFATE